MMQFIAYSEADLLFIAMIDLNVEDLMYKFSFDLCSVLTIVYWALYCMAIIDIAMYCTYVIFINVDNYLNVCD